MKREFYFGLVGGIRHLEKHYSEMAEKGWMIDKIGVLFHTYKAIEPCKMFFHVDVFPEIGIFDYPHSGEAISHRGLYENAGWTFVTSQREVNVFCCEGGQNAPSVPVYSNRTQNQIYMKAYRKAELISAIYTLIVIPFMLYFSLARLGVEIFLSDMMTFFLLGMPVIFAGVALHILTGAVWYLMSWRASMRDLPPPVISSWLYRLVKDLMVSGVLIFIICTIVGVVLEVRGGMPLSIIIFAFAFPSVGLIVGFALRRQIDTKDRAKGHNIAKVVVATLGVMVVAMIVGGIAIRFLPHSEWVEDIPGNHPAITFYSLGLPPAEHVFFDKSGGSLAVPVNYSQSETNPDSAVSNVFTQVRQAIHGVIARGLFEHAIENRIDWYIRRQQGLRSSLIYHRMDTGEANLWGADEGVLFLFGGETTVILLQDRTVLHVSTRDNRILTIDEDRSVLQHAVRELWHELKL